MRLRQVLSRARRWSRIWLRRTSGIAGEGVRLHLGCGDDYWPGWINVDSDRRVPCDLHADFVDIGKRYLPGTVSEVAMIHSLGYLRLWEARSLFADLYRALGEGGVFSIELPDLAKCAARVLQSEGNIAEYMEGVRGIYAFGMDQIAASELFTPYAFGWSAWHLAKELRDAGFRSVDVGGPQKHGRIEWRDTRIVARK